MKVVLFIIVGIVLSCEFVIDFAKFTNDPKHFWLRFGDCVIDALCIIGFAWIAKGAF